MRYAPVMTAIGLREQRRRARAEFHREHLLDAAEAVFGARGFQDATIKEIAERAEISVGAVYGIVDGKEDLLAQTLARRGTEFLAEMERVVAGSSDPRATLRSLADAQIGFFRRHPSFGRLWLRSVGPGRFGLSPSSLDRLGVNADRAVEMEADVIRRGQAAGVVRAGDPFVLAAVFSGIVQAYQANDPASVGEVGGERLALADLHALLEGAFAP
ncbi:MAG: TetR/AcrR family transcriptional regulator [Actinobacteria bacterium]|nr:TetR/AcrR family transcriptional regulator [Actinomycetota bacterium]